MEIIKNTFTYNLNILKYFKKNNICFLDIETTGLKRCNNNIILIGILYIDKNNVITKQFFCNKLDEEHSLLLKFKKSIDFFDYIITYNGENFDLPFINYKFNKYNINYNIHKSKSIDLFKKIKPYKNILNLDNLKLKSIEKYLNIYRKDDLNGKECISIYYSYLSSKDENLKNKIIQHNYEDIYYLPEILKIFDIIDYKTRINVHLPLNYFVENKIKINLSNIKNNKDIINIYCNTSIHNIYPIIYFKNDFNFKWYPQKGNLIVQLNIKKGKLSDNKTCLYINKENCDYTLNIKDKTEYKVCNNIILVKIKNNYEIENIKQIIENIFLTTIKQI